MTTPVQEGTLLLGKYRVEKELGRGAMGYVVAARHEHLGELFAVKLMLPDALARSDAAERFLREARACARLKSEHVVRVTDSGTNDDGVPVMVMEYLIGEDLQSILDKRRVFPMHEAVTYLLQVCDAVAEAHEIGIVHRDLKPSNLFLTRRPNGKPCVKVLDFGISKDMNPSGEKVSKLTATGSIIGTPYYMSPEQMQAKPMDGRADIWSLGVIFYELVTGRLAFPGENYAEVAGRVLYEKPVPPSRFLKNLPPQVDQIALRCLEKQPDNRFPTVREFAAALESLMSLPPPEQFQTDSESAVLVDTEKETVIQPSDAKSDGEASTLADGDEKPTIQRPGNGQTKAKSAVLGNSATLESATPVPPEAAAASKPSSTSAEEAPVFYAKRVFGHQTKKTWASNSRAGRRSSIGLILFGLLIFGLAAAGWYYKETIASTIKAFISKDNPEAAPSATTAPSNAASVAPETSASILPSASTAPRVAPKTGLSNTKTKATSSASATRSASAPPSAPPPAPPAPQTSSAPAPPPPPPPPPPTPSGASAPKK